MMASDTALTFDRLPSVTPCYVKAATTLSGGLSSGQTIPNITAHIANLTTRAEHLARYRKVCGFSRSSHLPITYPHVLAFPLHMAVLTHADFPLKLLGLIHVRNKITQIQPVGLYDSLDVKVSVGGHRETAKGVEFDLVTEVRNSSDTLVWHASSAMLSLQKTSAAKNDKKKRQGPPNLDFEPDQQTSWSLPANLGRMYAAAAGDYNPIHLSSWTAKIFGFKRAIAHGMWTKARAAAALSDRIADRECSISVSFKKPVYLPSEPVFCFASENHRMPLALTDKRGEIHHFTGELNFV